MSGAFFYSTDLNLVTQIRRRFSADLNVKLSKLEVASEAAECSELSGLKGERVWDERINLKPENDGESDDEIQPLLRNCTWQQRASITSFGIVMQFTFPVETRHWDQQTRCFYAKKEVGGINYRPFHREAGKSSARIRATLTGTEL